MIRSSVAVLGGYLVFALGAAFLFPLAGRDPKVWPGFAFAVFSTVFGMIFAFLGGYVAARIAAANRGRHALIVAGLIALVAVLSALLQASSASVWSEVCALVFMAPSAALPALWMKR